ncbi:hypothetical protein QZH41_014160, partial [Actinostola sp. cb2023]
MQTSHVLCVIFIGTWPLCVGLMNVDKTIRSVFDRTCQRLLQMVMATEIPSNGSTDQNQVKSDAMSGTMKGAPNSSTPSERHIKRALRSKSARQNSKFISQNDLQDQNRHENERVPPTRQLEAGEGHDNSNHKADTNSQVAHLRQLLLLHLELIQQQQEKLQKRDRELNQLKIEKEQLESRIHRMERRMAVKKRRGDFVNNDFETVPEAAKPTAPKRRLSSEQMIRSKRVPATASVVISSHTSNDASFDSNMRTELLYLHPNTPQSDQPEPLPAKQISNLPEVKTDESKDDEPEGEARSIVDEIVRKVRIKVQYKNSRSVRRVVRSAMLESHCVTTSCQPQRWTIGFYIEITWKFMYRSSREFLLVIAFMIFNPTTIMQLAIYVQNTDDESFSKRHCKQEAEEKRRKRWDVQRFRAKQLHKNLEERNRLREESRLKGRKFRGKDCNSDSDIPFQSFLPSKDDIVAIEVSETVPVSVFGFPVPLFQV